MNDFIIKIDQKADTSILQINDFIIKIDQKAETTLDSQFWPQSTGF